MKGELLHCAIIDSFSSTSTYFIITVFHLSAVTYDYQLIWMGLRQDDQGGYYWTDGTPLDYTNYKTDQPDDYHGADNCIINDWYYSYSNGWESHNCESEMPFFCEVVAGMVAPTTAAPPTVPPALPCDEG